MSAKKNVMPEGVEATGDAQVDQILELTADLQRTRADFENYRKQMEAQKSGLVRLGEEKMLLKILPVVDTIQIAVAHNSELEPVQKQIEKALSEMGVGLIEAKEGTVFDPDLHEAVSADDSEGETEVVASVLRPGYMLGDEILRPAMVSVTRK